MMNDKEVIAKLAKTYQDLTNYWTSRRPIMGYQTVEYIGNQAAHCAKLAAHYSKIEASNVH